MLFIVICTDSTSNIAILTSIASECKYSLCLCALYYHAFVNTFSNIVFSTQVKANLIQNSIKYKPA